MAGNPCNIIPDQEIVLEGGAKLVPAPEATDAGKVLGVINQEGGIGWVEGQGGGGTVDQTYNASSANAQSGTAVAQAIASIPSSSYAAGNGIEISNDKIAVRAGKNLSFANTLVAHPFYSPTRNYQSSWAWSFIGQLTMTRLTQLRQGMRIEMKAGASLNMTGATGGAHFAICRKNSDNTPDLSGNVVLIASAALSTDTSQNFVMGTWDTFVANFSSLSPKSVGNVYYIDDSNVNEFYLTVISYAADGSVTDAKYINGIDYYGVDVHTSDYYTENPDVKELVAVDQLPASTYADKNKVLTVNAFGTPNWQTPSSVTVDQTYNASSANAQSGTAVAEAVGAPVNLVQGSGVTLTESSGNVTISANAQLPAYSDADSGKVLQVQADGTLAWVTLS